MNVPIDSHLADRIFNVTAETFAQTALDVFRYQVANNEVYAAYLQQLRHSGKVDRLTDIPPLPISFFKTHRVRAFEGAAEAVFTSSGTTGTTTSRHEVTSLAWYTESFTKGFRHFYGDPGDFAFLCLLPSYTERTGSSLVYMAEQLVAASSFRQSGFFLKAEDDLMKAISECRLAGARIILLGVTFALLDFAERHHGFDLHDVIVMETGGMKGRREEMPREKLHTVLKNAFQLPAVHSEYGMTELMSQAYSFGNGIFNPPPWMRVLVRSEDDPFVLSEQGTGLLVLVDLANLYSCSFLETQDLGRVFADGSFEVIGRMDNSDIRGCSLLVV